MRSRSGEQLAIHVATLFVFTESGRIQHVTDPVRSAGPRLYLAGCETGNVVRIRHDVSEDTARMIDALAEDEPPLCEPDSTPVHLDDYVGLLAAEGPIERLEAGVSYYFPDHLDYEHDVTLVRSDTPDGDCFLAGVPADGGFDGWNHPVDGHICAPWCMALHDGAVASIVETVRIGPTGAEAGVTTSPRLRGRGFAAAATAGWASHPSLRGRTLFYSTTRANVSSQRVTERLGLRFIGASLSLNEN